jgi:hypothetical protein
MVYKKWLRLEEFKSYKALAEYYEAKDGSEEEEEEFEVENIMDDKIRNGRMLFKIKWKGFPDEDSYVPIHYLNCPQLLAEYFKEKDEKMEKQVIRIRKLVEMEENEQEENQKKKVKENEQCVNQHEIDAESRRILEERVEEMEDDFRRLEQLERELMNHLEEIENENDVEKENDNDVEKEEKEKKQLEEDEIIIL